MFEFVLVIEGYFDDVLFYFADLTEVVHLVLAVYHNFAVGELFLQLSCDLLAGYRRLF